MPKKQVKTNKADKAEQIKAILKEKVEGLFEREPRGGIKEEALTELAEELAKI